MNAVLYHLILLRIDLKLNLRQLATRPSLLWIKNRRLYGLSQQFYQIQFSDQLEPEHFKHIVPLPCIRNRLRFHFRGALGNGTFRLESEIELQYKRHSP